MLVVPAVVNGVMKEGTIIFIVCVAGVITFPPKRPGAKKNSSAVYVPATQVKPAVAKRKLLRTVPEATLATAANIF
ncbi:hypothetical protein D3C86_1441200 [compost metagenome]